MKKTAQIMFLINIMVYSQKVPLEKEVALIVIIVLVIVVVVVVGVVVLRFLDCLKTQPCPYNDQ